MATVFEPIRPVPPMTTIFMVYPPARKYPGLNVREHARVPSDFLARLCA
jgi:hypothetical protein